MLRVFRAILKSTSPRPSDAIQTELNVTSWSVDSIVRLLAQPNINRHHLQTVWLILNRVESNYDRCDNRSLNPPRLQDHRRLTIVAPKKNRLTSVTLIIGILYVSSNLTQRNYQRQEEI